MHRWHVNISLSFLSEKNLNSTFGHRSLENHLQLWNVLNYSCETLFKKKKTGFEVEEKRSMSVEKIKNHETQTMRKRGEKCFFKRMCSHKLEFNLCY